MDTLMKDSMIHGPWKHLKHIKLPPFGRVGYQVDICHHNITEFNT